MYPQRCTDDRPHGPHRVRARYRKRSGTWEFTYGFTCPGALESDRLDEAFGGPAMSRGPN